jgi:hypothetical protein
VCGEAKIKNIEYLDFKGILDKYLDRLIISKKELELYSIGRKLKKAQILELEGIKLYKTEKKVLIPMTMQGFYVTDKNKKRIFEENKII